MKRKEPLTFRFGRYILRSLSIPALSLQTPCTELSCDIAATLAQLPPLPPDCEAIVLPAHPIKGDFPRLKGLFGSVIRYVPNAGARHLIDLSGTFKDYSSRFSGRRRNTLARRVRKFAEFSGGTHEMRIFSRPEEMPEFRRAAVTLSESSYKAQLGATFQDLAISVEELAEAASCGGVRGYVLYCGPSPAACVYCRVQGANLLYVYPAYAPGYASLSPGTVLLWLTLQSLFDEQRFKYLDFLWGVYPYKLLFSTTAIRVAAVYCFRGTLRNRLLVLSHLMLLILSKWMKAATARLRVSRLVQALGEKMVRRSQQAGREDPL